MDRPTPYGGEPEESFLSTAIFDKGFIHTSVGLNALVPGMGAGAFSMIGLVGQHFIPQALKPVTSPLFAGHFTLGGDASRNTAMRILGRGIRDRGARYAAYNRAAGNSGIANRMTGGLFDKLATKSGLIDAETLAGNRAVSAAVFKSMGRVGYGATVDAFAGGAGAKLGARAGAHMLVGGSIAMRVLGPVAWGMMAYDAYRGFQSAYKGLHKMSRAMNERTNKNATLATDLADSQEAMTGRREALSAISQSRMNARSAFGGEARRVHF